jgi:obg-like ATPase 1
LNEITLLTSKPVVYLINLSAKDYQRKANKWLAKIKAWVDTHGADPLIPFSVTLEQELAELPDDAARAAKCDELKVQSALPKIVTTGYHRLNLVHFFTAGEDEVRCWTVRKGTKAVSCV